MVIFGKKDISLLELILRLGVFGTFLGHGIFALLQKVTWLPFLTFWGISEKTGLQLMIVIGVVDIFVAVITLLKPISSILLYATAWAFLTALMRPISGGMLLEFIERSANWATPFALYLFLRFRSSPD